MHAEAEAFADATPAVEPGPFADARGVAVGADDPAGFDI